MVWHFHPIAFVEHMKLITGDPYTIRITRKWEVWTGQNKYSSTFGTFTLGDIEGYIGEPYGEETTERGKDKRIPIGTYNLTWHTSPKFPKNKYVSDGKPELKNGFPKLYNEKVPKSRGILIHMGTDGGWSEGCILPGEDLKKKSDGTIEKMSKEGSYKRFYQIIDHLESIGIEKIKMIITDEID
ncbi:DUF5675 family protein [Aquimarina longa]|uniref:DUF5675 family protein n=1 Tax=Aquimarina longa TaxID=1080221 RepID=UPI000785D372|nr:DUF5675 family protein [Aquimarina longa]